MSLDPGAMPVQWLEDTQKRYQLYVNLHQHRHIYTRNQRKLILDEIMRGRCYSWRVVGISLDALKAFSCNGFSREAKKAHPMHRAHLVPRIATADEIFRRERPMASEELAEFQWQRDMTVLCLRKENVDPLPTEKVIPFNNLDWTLFASQHGIKISKKEENFLRTLAASETCGTPARGPG